MIFWAIKKSLANYNIDSLKSDLMSGFVVSLVALPLSMALSIAVGLPPQHGIYTAIVAGIITPILGGSIHQVSGPTAAFVVILAPIVSQYGLRGLILASFLSGIILVIMSFLKIGRFINFVPYEVITGFTSGIAIVIGVLSLNDFLGLNIAKNPENFLDKLFLILNSLNQIQYQELLISLVSLFLIAFMRNKIKFIPSTIIGIVIGIVLSIIFKNNGYFIQTIGSRFPNFLSSSTNDLGGQIYIPTLQFFGFSKSKLFDIPNLTEIYNLIIPAIIIAALSALESLLSASVADGMTKTKHNPNSELFAIGIGNILSSLASGIPATGAIARTATNIESGAKTPIGSSLHGVFILFYVIIFIQYISYIPMSSLAALLLYTAFRMSHYKEFIKLVKIGNYKDSIVLIFTFIFTLFFDMVIGITIGVTLSFIVNKDKNIREFLIKIFNK